MDYSDAEALKGLVFVSCKLGDLAAEHIKWEETGSALEILKQQLIDDPHNFRARADYIVALRQQHRMKEVLEQYRILEKAGRPIPYWVTAHCQDRQKHLQQSCYQPGLRSRFAQNLEAYLRDYDYTVIMAYPQMEKIGGSGKVKKWLRELVNRLGVWAAPIK